MIDQQGNVAHEFQIVAETIGNFLGAAQVFDIGFQNAVENVVGRKDVFIFLVGAQLGGGRLV